MVLVGIILGFWFYKNNKKKAAKIEVAVEKVIEKVKKKNKKQPK